MVIFQKCYLKILICNLKMLNYQNDMAILFKECITQEKEIDYERQSFHKTSLLSSLISFLILRSPHHSSHGTYFQLQQHWYILWSFRHWQPNINYSFCCSALQLFYIWFTPVKRAQCNNCITDIFNLQVGWLEKCVSKCSVFC